MNERDRIEFIMKCYNLSPSQLADKTGIQRASVSHILSGRNRASLEVMQKVHEAFPDVDLVWLITGNGNPPSQSTRNTDVQSPSVDTALFPLNENSATEPAAGKLHDDEPVQRKQGPVKKAIRRQNTPRQNMQPVTSAKQVKEIRIFYTDGTYETFFPER